MTGAWKLTRLIQTPRSQPCAPYRCPGPEFLVLDPEQNRGRRVNSEFPGERPGSFAPSGRVTARTSCPLSEIPKTSQTGGSGTGHRAVSGASESAWSASTRRSQAALRSPEVMARCEERHEWRGPGRVSSVRRLNTASHDVPAGTRCRRIESIRASHRAERGQGGSHHVAALSRRRVRRPCGQGDRGRGVAAPTRAQAIALEHGDESPCVSWRSL